MTNRPYRLLLVALLLVQWSALGQAPKPAATNEVINGNFLKFTPQDNLWDGVNALGGLGGFPRAAYAVTESGPPGSVALPISVNWADMNGDGLGDIVTCDPLGVMRVYFNSGSKTEPKF